MMIRRKLKALADYAADPHAIPPRIRWPQFNWGIYRTVRRLRGEGLEFSALLDVGAHVGLFSYGIAEAYPEVVVHGFEPLVECHAQFGENLRRFDSDRIRLWPYALGNRDGEAEFRVSQSLASSSVLRMLESHVDAFPRTGCTETRTVPIRRLDTVRPELGITGDALLKLDVQGFELEVLQGAVETLPAVRHVLVEISVVPLYRGAPLFEGIFDFLRDHGLRFVAPLEELAHPATGRLLQFDALFSRPGS
jgi:FkbM family methyltransferase